MKRITMIGFAALMGLAVIAPLAASADEHRHGYAAPVRHESVRIELRNDTHDRDRDRRDGWARKDDWDRRNNREHEQYEHARYDNDRRDCR